MRFIQITNDPNFASKCESAGVERIMVDLERKGKEERQRGRDTLISQHDLTDIPGVRRCLSKSQVMVRVNPWDSDSPTEVDEVIHAGAQVVMLPMFRHPGEVEAFVEAVNGRASTCLLLETASAVARMDEILNCAGIDEIHVGLNDLHIEMRVDFMFELVSGGLIPHLARQITEVGIPFGFGGVGAVGDPSPVCPVSILGEHVRLGSTAVILSRAFSRPARRQVGASPGEQYAIRIQALRRVLDGWNVAGEEALLANRKLLREQVVEAAGLIAGASDLAPEWSQ